MLSVGKYELWASQGQGGDKVAEFDTLEEALAEFKRVEGQASLAIKYPNGQFHDWSQQQGEVN